jgi:lycopene cyclase domain-containing protein
MKYTYLILNIMTIMIPLIMSFEKKLNFIKNIKEVSISILSVLVLFIIWDIWFTSIGVWSFNPDYITGVYLLGLPLEEWLFFIAIPYSLLFVYENIKTFTNFKKSKNFEQYFNLFLLFTFMLIASYSKTHIYTFLTFTLLCIFLVFSFIFTFKFNFKTVYISYLIALLPFFIVNGILTYLPVVIYNDNENLGIRLISIPVEDVFYGLLMFFGNVSIFEYLRSRKERIKQQ